MEHWGFAKYKQADKRTASPEAPPTKPCKHPHAEVKGTATIQSSHYDCPQRRRADLAVALGHVAYASELLSQLHERAAKTEASLSVKGNLLQASLFCGADTTEKRERAQAVLDELWSKLLQDSEAGFRLEVLIIANLVDYLEHDSKAKNACKQAVRQKIIGHSWSSLDQPFKVADFVTYRALIHSISASVGEHDPEGERCIADFLAAQPVRFWAKSFCPDDPCKPSALLDCIKWIPEILEFMDLDVPGFLWQLAETEDPQWLGHATLLTALLPIAEAGRPSWWLSCLNETGIPPTLLLSFVCRMVLMMSPFDKSTDQVLPEEPSSFMRSDIHWEPATQTHVLKKGSSYLPRTKNLVINPKDLTWMSFVSFVTTLEVDETRPSSGESLQRLEHWLGRLEHTTIATAQHTSLAVEAPPTTLDNGPDSGFDSPDDLLGGHAEVEHATVLAAGSNSDSSFSPWLDLQDTNCGSINTFSETPVTSQIPDLPASLNFQLRFDSDVA